MFVYVCNNTLFFIYLNLISVYLFHFNHLALDFVASLLGVPSMSLQSALQVRTMTTQHGGMIRLLFIEKKKLL